MTFFCKSQAPASRAILRLRCLQKKRQPNTLQPDPQAKQQRQQTLTNQETRVAAVAAGQTIRGRKAGFIRDLISVSERAVRSVARDPETTIPALVIPVFMYLMTVGALEDFAESIPGLDYRAFQLPVAVLFAVTGISRATTVVADIQSGYFDRLVMTPVNRLALLLGLMVADFFLVVALTIPVIIMGFIAGVGFETGIAGILVFMFLAGIWGLIFSGFPYAIAFKTGNAAAVNTSFLLFFPFLFMTSLFVPQDQMTGWMSTAADFNPVTYLLAALRSMIYGGWDAQVMRDGIIAIAAVGVVSIGMALAALKGRATRK
ncbi:MAG: ABC transporter permease [Chloroflexi bacterium]|nr:ABC transporter permease [Chloroflexota bacterium]MYE41095.1 ABC transporter permease [Chloroflexota bacterium]